MNERRRRRRSSRSATGRRTSRRRARRARRGPRPRGGGTGSGRGGRAAPPSRPGDDAGQRARRTRAMPTSTLETCALGASNARSCWRSSVGYVGFEVHHDRDRDRTPAGRRRRRRDGVAVGLDDVDRRGRCRRASRGPGCGPSRRVVVQRPSSPARAAGPSPWRIGPFFAVSPPTAIVAIVARRPSSGRRSSRTAGASSTGDVGQPVRPAVERDASSRRRRSAPSTNVTPFASATATRGASSTARPASRPSAIAASMFAF